MENFNHERKVGFGVDEFLSSFFHPFRPPQRAKNRLGASVRRFADSYTKSIFSPLYGTFIGLF